MVDDNENKNIKTSQRYLKYVKNFPKIQILMQSKAQSTKKVPKFCFWAKEFYL
jgi:hypothetical protein